MARSPKSESYEQAWSGHWFDVEPPLIVSCCDCGLTHEIGVRIHGGKLQVQLTENRRRTGQLRRHHAHACQPVKGNRRVKNK